MFDNKLDFLNEESFKLFMSEYEPVEDLDKITDKFPEGAKIADYMIKDIVVIELKTLKSDPTEKMERFFHEIMTRDDFPAIYGELNFRRVVSLLSDGNKVIRKFETVAFRQIESIMSKANKQVISTIENLKLNSKTAGTLIIINEYAEFFEPDVLVNYIMNMLNTKNSQQEFRFSNLHNVILFQNTHKVEDCNQNGISIPMYHIVNDNIEETDVSKKACIALGRLLESYSHFYKCKHETYNVVDQLFGIEKLQESRSREPLNLQELVEDQYRKNRYMKDFTDEDLIKYGSRVMSVCLAVLLKDNPLVMEDHDKMLYFKQLTELFEESRLRPFDLKRLDIDPRKYTSK